MVVAISSRRAPMLDLNNRDWAPFKISDLFKPARGTEKNMTSLQVGDVPLISARNCDNGVKAFVSIPNERLHRGHAITLNNDGDGGAGLAYYQPMEFALDTHVTDLRPRDSIGNLSRYAMQFVAASISKQRTLFGHGRSISLKRLNLLRVMLPIDESSNPDWQFMEDYIREREAIQVQRCREFLIKRIVSIERERVNNPEFDHSSLHERDWKSYSISQIFDIRSGRRLESRNRKYGRRPFIGALDNSNGIAGFTADKNSSLDNNVLGVNYNGNGVCLGFYHPYECIFSDDVKRFHVKNNKGNEFIYLFLKVAIQQQKSKFGYLYKFNATRMARQTIMLPSVNGGEPDFTFMELFGMSITLQLLLKQLAYLEKMPA